MDYILILTNLKFAENWFKYKFNLQKTENWFMYVNSRNACAVF